MVKPSKNNAEPETNIQNREEVKPKEFIRESTEKWFARNRSLVLRQTPIWAQSLTGIVVFLGFASIAAGIIFRIDEVVTVTGQLETIGGKIDVKTPAGGKVAEVLFEDGNFVQKGELMMRFDTRQATND